jgi:hypothetical protein
MGAAPLRGASRISPTAFSPTRAALISARSCRLQLVRRFAAAAVLAEQMESRLANGEQIDIQEHALLCSTLTRLAQRIGIERRARDVTPPDPLRYAREYDAS